MSTSSPPARSPVRRAAGALLRSPVGSVLEHLAAPHGIDRYLELVDPLLARDETRAVVTEVRRETADTTSLTLRPSRWGGHRAGQFVRLTVEIDGRRRTRCYSLTSSEHRRDGLVTIAVKADPSGRVSPHLASAIRPGAVVTVSDPEGDFTLPRPRPARVLLISGGSGITPVMSILRTLADEGAGTEVTFLHYARTAGDVPFRDELRELHRRGAASVVTVLTRDPDASALGLTGHLTSAHLAAVLPDATADDVRTYVCGPAALIDATTQRWQEDDAADRLAVERFRPAAPAAVTDVAAGTITLARSGTSIENDGRPMLDQVEAAGLTPEFGCRMGICHTCTTPKLAGRVRDTRDGRVSPDDAADVQLCISVPAGDVEIDL